VLHLISVYECKTGRDEEGVVMAYYKVL